MKWKRENFRLISDLRENFTAQEMRKLADLHIRTLEDLIALYETRGVREILAENLEVDAGRLDELVDRASAKARLSHLVDLLAPVKEDHVAKWGLGALPPETASKTASNEIPEFFEDALSDLPDLPGDVSLVGEMPPVKDQGSRGTCVAFGTNAVWEYLNRNRHPGVSFSEQLLYWRCKLRDKRENSPGTRVHHAAASLKEDGICKNETWPYNPRPTHSEHQGPPPDQAGVMAEARKFRTAGGVSRSGEPVAWMKSILAGTPDMPGRPVSIGVPVYSSWYRNPITARTGRIPMPLPGESHSGGHCMTAVGYRDDPGWAGGGYFILRNSWGTSWARESEHGPGYGAIPYAYIQKDLWEAWTLVEAEQEQEEEIMPNAAFTTKTLILGVVIGLLIVAALLFYPDLKKRLQEPATPPAAGTAVAPEIPPAPPRPAEPEENTGETVLETEEIEVPEEVAKAEPIDRKPPEFQDAAPAMGPYLSGEELGFRELLAQTPPAEILNTYPHAECFRVAAEENGLNPALLVGLASYCSLFDTESKLKNHRGILHLDPENSRVKSAIEMPEVLTEDPCANIRVAAGMLAGYFKEADNRFVPALVAFRDQAEKVRPELITNDDLFFLSRVKKRVGRVMEEPYKPENATPWFFFQDRVTAERNQAKFEEASGLELWMGWRDGKYWLNILDEDDEGSKAARLKEATGLNSLAK